MKSEPSGSFFYARVISRVFWQGIQQIAYNAKNTNVAPIGYGWYVA